MPPRGSFFFFLFFLFPRRRGGGGGKAHPLRPCRPLGLSEWHVVGDPVVEHLHPPPVNLFPSSTTSHGNWKPRAPGTGMPTFFSASCRQKDGDTTVRTSSGTVISKGLKTSTSWSTICGTGSPRIRTMGARSTICSTVCRCTRTCGGGSSTGPGRPPPASSSYNWKSSGWGAA